MKYQAELSAAIAAAKLAEVHILKVYGTSFDVEIKSDDSPVTAADKGADEIIRNHLAPLFPEDGFLTEESQDTPERFSKKRIWIVDPVDGTKEFVSRNGQFTTNIALAEEGRIVVGVINVPTMGILYYAVEGEGAFCMEKDGKVRKIHVSDRKDHLRTMRSISFFNEKEKAFLSAHAAAFEGEPVMVGAALKFCLLAQGDYEFFYRISAGTKEWDVAPGDLLVAEAGGIMVDGNGKRFTYNRHDVYNRDGYMMANCPENLFGTLK